MKKFYVSIFFSFFLMFFLTSCVTPDSVMKTWIGGQINEVILQWGPADNIQPDGQGGIVYTWYFRNRSYTASRTFICDKNGKIYAYRWQGL